MKKILIVGGLGYLGPVIASELKKHISDLYINCIDLNLFQDAAFDDFYHLFNNIFIKDKRNIEAEDLKKTDVVIDLAAVSNDPMGHDFENATMDINYKSSINLANLAKKNGVKKYIFASSCSIYGVAGDESRKEDDPKNPLTAYAKSKWYTEQDLSKIANNNFSIIALRFATACGWSPMFRADLVLNDFILNALTENSIKVLSDGTPWRPLIHTNDIAKAVTWAAVSNFKKPFDYYNIGSNQWTLTIKELAESVANVLGVKYEIVGESGADKRSYKVDFGKFTEIAPEWTPAENINTSIINISDNLKKHPQKIKNFRQGNLIRLNVLRNLIKSNQIDMNLKKVN